jgi:hypothetical protein
MDKLTEANYVLSLMDVACSGLSYRRRQLTSGAINVTWSSFNGQLHRENPVLSGLLSESKIVATGSSRLPIRYAKVTSNH